MVFYNFKAMSAFLLFAVRTKGDMVQTIQHGGVLKYVEWNLKPGEQNYICTCNVSWSKS